MNGFRLLEVSSDPGRVNELDFDSLSSMTRSFEVAPRSTRGAGDDTWMSVMIGRNGLGKSRTLGGIASLFASARNGRLTSRSRDNAVWRVRYVIGPDECELWNTSGGVIRALKNGSECPAENIPLPSRVVALSTTATDKFPLPARIDLKDDSPPDGVYSYMGLRDYTGRASATTVAFRALEALVEASDATHDRRVRIAAVFDFLGYAPRVTHTYRWRYGSAVREPNSIRRMLETQTQSPLDRTVAQRLRRLVEKDPDVEFELQRIVDDAVQATSPRRELGRVVDFRAAGPRELAWFRDMQLLKRAGLVDLNAVELERSDTGLKINLREVSSGELSLVTAFLGLAAVIEEGALVLIDEPEVSLHPQWQSQYLGLLTQIFANYLGCHFVVATHSPLVVSDISPDAANVVSLDPQRQVLEPGADYAGDSVDEVLVKAFNVAGNNNLYVKQLLVEALRLAADGALSSFQFAKVMDPLERLEPSLEPDSPARELISQLRQVREEPES